VIGENEPVSPRAPDSAHTTLSRRSFVSLVIPALGLAAAAFPRRIQAAQAAVQTFNGPMADADAVYKPVTLAECAPVNDRRATR
jgi:hypothetical protein